jgi:hypothetical protein
MKHPIPVEYDFLFECGMVSLANWQLGESFPVHHAQRFVTPQVTQSVGMTSKDFVVGKMVTGMEVDLIAMGMIVTVVGL